ncbi:putative glutamine-rich protein 2 isoform X3 [Apostichopus japonicus]|uniref:Putative glutamine-rich protein 2 isoform X3 n=1 Tax=Stichopus japonicus TaxID=307972 RepID=A0A2G8KHJ2_STIJA|nr:putative glutamine-rich protein 2 isoform X3 [Apostichopus japonicus]
MELDPLKAYLDKRIKAANAKVIRKEPDMPEDAAGFRKQLIQKFHCISCDRPLDMAPQAPLASLPESKGLPGTRSGRPYTTFELEQIRAAQKSNQYQDVPEYFVTNRSCGGSHTLTYPHRRVTRITHLSNIVQTEDVATAIVNGKVETDVVGQDGHIYKARISPTQMDHLPTLAQPKIQSARTRSRLGSAHMRAQTAPSAMLDDPMQTLPSPFILQAPIKTSVWSTNQCTAPEQAPLSIASQRCNSGRRRRSSFDAEYIARRWSKVNHGDNPTPISNRRNCCGVTKQQRPTRYHTDHHMKHFTIPSETTFKSPRV